MCLKELWLPNEFASQNQSPLKREQIAELKLCEASILTYRSSTTFTFGTDDNFAASTTETH